MYILNIVLEDFKSQLVFLIINKFYKLFLFFNYVWFVFLSEFPYSLINTSIKVQF